MLKLPIGVDNFQELVKGGYLFCDKTAMLAELLNKGDKVTLITRPRRWGKTLNMSMLQHFFAEKVNGLPTKDLFEDLAIAKLERGTYLEKHQGKYPVIMLSFKDINSDTFEGAYNKIKKQIASLFSSFEYLLESSKLNKLQLRTFKTITNQSADQQDLEDSLHLLSQCLYQHHGSRVYILIDEYDTPLNKAYGNKDYLEAMVRFMRNLFSAALKGNNALERGILTGILRISKDSMLSGLNNLSTYTLLDEEYSAHFGFSEFEVSSLLKKQQLATSINEIKDWYNGYKIGRLVIYNPWSIINCLNKEGHFDVYWVHTGNNDLIKELVLSADSNIKEYFEELMQGNTLEVSIDKHLSFDLLGKSENALWSLLLFAGYLTWEKASLSEDSDLYDSIVKIPNQEVRRLYNRFFKDWLLVKFPSRAKYDTFLNSLLEGKIEDFTEYLRTYLLESISFFDVSSNRQGESFYHGFVLALLASIRKNYSIRSNRESGLGRYDLLLIPKEQNKKALLLEFKHTPKQEELESTAKIALEQIQTKAYATELAHYPYLKEVVHIGIAFSKKSLLVAYTTYDLLSKKTSEVRVV